MHNDGNRITSPVFVMGPARSGTSLLHSLICTARDIWTPYREMHSIYESEIGAYPNLVKGESNLLTETHVTPQRKATVRQRLWEESFNVELFGVKRDFSKFSTLLAKHATLLLKRFHSAIRVADKNPKHCFRIRFLKKIFPDAKFVIIFREPRSNINSLIEGWESGGYKTYTLPEGVACDASIEWSFDLPPGYTEWADSPLPERCAHQWAGYTNALIDAVEHLPASSVAVLKYNSLVDAPLDVMERVFEIIEVPMDPAVQNHCLSLPVVNSVSSPSPDKWKKRKNEISALVPRQP